MKVVLAGSRDFCDAMTAWNHFDKFHSQQPITEVVCGKARGVDTWGELWAKNKGIPVKEFPADWKKHGKAAGPIRNKQMAEYADAALVIYFPHKSKGSKDMIKQMKKLNKPVVELPYG